MLTRSSTLNTFVDARVCYSHKAKGVKFYELLFIISTICITPLRIFTYIQTLPNIFRLSFTFTSLICFLLGLLFSPKPYRGPLIIMLVSSFALFSLNWYGQWKNMISYFEKMYADYLFFLPVLLGVFYIFFKNQKVKKYLLIYLIFMELVTLVTTLYGLRLYPSASRNLASEAASLSIYKKMNIGGYDFIYGLLVLIPFLLYMIKKSKHKFTWIFIFLLSLFCISISQYTIALLLSIITISFYLFSKIKKKKIKYLIIILLLLLCIVSIGFYDYILNGVGDIMYRLGLDAVGQKFYDIVSSLDSDSSAGTVQARIYQYTLSVDAIIKSPFFGRLFNQSYSVGGHSEILDIWASGGIISLLLAVFLLRKFLILFKMNFNDELLKKTLFLACAIFIVLGLINTVLNSPLIAINIFLVPSLVNDSKENNRIFGEKYENFMDYKYFDE